MTGCIIKVQYLPEIEENIMNIKNEYWTNGYYTYKNQIKRVCFHSREIRRKEDAFFLDKKTYKNFIMDLNNFLSDLKTTIISMNINKKSLVEKYSNPFDPYRVSLTFIIERFLIFLNKRNSNGIIILEARGKKEDKILLDHVKKIIKEGKGYRKSYIGASDFQKRIKGAFFNPKWQKNTNHKKSYFGLEITDLMSYPIHSYIRSNMEEKSYPFKVLENKLKGYPNYYGKGLKLFP